MLGQQKGKRRRGRRNHNEFHETEENPCASGTGNDRAAEKAEDTRQSLVGGSLGSQHMTGAWLGATGGAVEKRIQEARTHTSHPERHSTLGSGRASEAVQARPEPSAAGRAFGEGYVS